MESEPNLRERTFSAASLAWEPVCSLATALVWVSISVLLSPPLIFLFLSVYPACKACKYSGDSPAGSCVNVQLGASGASSSAVGAAAW